MLCTASGLPGYAHSVAHGAAMMNTKAVQQVMKATQEAADALYFSGNSRGMLIIVVVDI